MCLRDGGKKSLWTRSNKNGFNKKTIGLTRDFQMRKLVWEEANRWERRRMYFKHSDYRFSFGIHGSQRRIKWDQLEENLRVKHVDISQQCLFVLTDCFLQELCLKITEKEDNHEETCRGLRNLPILYVFPGNSFLASPNLLRHINLLFVEKQMSKSWTPQETDLP